MNRLSPLKTLLLSVMLVTTAVANDDVEREQQRIAREMIQVLNAYAVYKMGQYEEAFSRYKVLAEAGNQQGMLNVANMYAKGLGVEQNPSLAFAWYQRSAEAGDAISMLELAQAYRHGQGVEADETRALYWFRQAANAGEPDAQWQLARHLMAEGDADEARLWAERAAHQGQVAAQQFLRLP
jgi:hypothetical protein